MAQVEPSGASQVSHGQPHRSSKANASREARHIAREAKDGGRGQKLKKPTTVKSRCGCNC